MRRGIVAILPFWVIIRFLPTYSTGGGQIKTAKLIIYQMFAQLRMLMSVYKYGYRLLSENFDRNFASTHFTIITLRDNLSGGVSLWFLLGWLGIRTDLEQQDSTPIIFTLSLFFHFLYGEDAQLTKLHCRCFFRLWRIDPLWMWIPNRSKQRQLGRRVPSTHSPRGLQRETPPPIVVFQPPFLDTLPRTSPPYG